METTLEIKKPSRRDMVYFRQNQRNEVFQSVVAFFAKTAEENKLTKKQLAELVGKNPSQITRWFSGPRNWELDTISDILLAMNARMVHEIVPLSEKIQANNIEPIRSINQPEATTTGSSFKHTVFVGADQSYG